MNPNLHRSISFQRATPSARAVAAPGGENQPVPQVHIELGLHNPVVCSSNSRMTTIPCCRTIDLQQGIDHPAGAVTHHLGIGRAQRRLTQGPGWSIDSPMRDGWLQLTGATQAVQGEASYHRL
jgi:hypothetical protein